MAIIRKLTIEDIKNFLQTKGFSWDGRIRDHWKMRYAPATIEEFKGNKMVSLVVTHKNHKDEFIQRIIVSPVKFRIEKPSLRKMDNFISFNEEWIQFLKQKAIDLAKNPSEEQVTYSL